MAPRGRVLLVSSFDDRELYAEWLRTHDLLVNEAADPEAAVEHIDRVSPDVVVTDFVFLGRPALAGPALIRAMRLRLDPSVSIVVVSGYVRREDRERARRAGADLYLVKPTLPSAVLFEVKRALILRRSGRRLSWNWRETPEATPSDMAMDRRRTPQTV